MVPPPRVAAIIPARMASSRFPGKPLLEIAGLPMLEHVRRRALLCGAFSEVVVATCDEEIARVVRGYGGRVVLTSPEHPAATDRVAEAARSVDCTHVVNVQGDEILVLPSDLRKMVFAIEQEPAVLAWNAVAPITEDREMADRSVVKCVVSSSGRVLFCGRDFSGLPLKKAEGFEPARVILGILGYERSFLDRCGGLARTPLETAESVDQSRIIEHDVDLRTVPFSKAYIGINEKREIPVVEECLRADAAQQEVLKQLSDLAGRPR